MIAAKHTMMGGRRVNFVPAAYSDGTACLVAPYVHQNVEDAKVRIVFRIDGKAASMSGKNLFGYSRNDSLWLLNNYNASGEFQLYSATYAGRFYFRDYNDSAYHEVIASRKNHDVSLFIDGSLLFNKYVSASPVKGRMGVFTQNDIDGDAVNPISGRSPANVPIAAFDQWDGGELVTSLRPCIDPSGIVCFYDLVSKTYLYSVTGGNFHAEYDFEGDV